ncbi:adhesin transport system outer membrane protein [Sphingopyxis panaciterrulae]|uniref:Adhesin transport system outer membrane protein n=1 Tax=Sphingopyxis panaciterrulae TaxID=462372 RepID=A0A7W9ESY7_9SPHN|nr:adhesin transport system outer membrane protein [Sphingopyxis panaciterrulae]
MGGKLILAIGLLSILSGASTPDTSPLLWEAAVREAVQWHPSVTESVGRLQARAEEIDIAKAGYKPQISGGIGSSYDNVTQSRWRPRANLSASQMLFDFGKVASSVAAAEAGTRIGRAELLLAVDSLIRDTSYAVIEIQRDMALRQVALDQLASIQSINELVHHRYRLGASTKSDALQAQARVQAAEVALQEIEAERRRWDSNLAYLLGRPTAPDVSLDPPPGLHGACARGEPDWSRVPAIMQAEAQRDEAMAEFRRSKAESLPTISLGAGGGADIHDPFSRRAEYNFGIQISSALYSGGARRARTRSAGYSLAAADAAEARVRNEVGRLLAEGERQVTSLTAVIDTLRARRASMDETGRLYRLQYLDMGTRTLVDLLNAEQELHQVRFDLVNSQYDTRRLQIDCLFYSGAQRDVFGLNGMAVRGVTL